MLYNIKLTDKELDILVSSLKASSIDKGVIEVLTNYILSEKKAQEIQKEEYDKNNEKNRIIIDNIVSRNLAENKEVTIDERAKKASELHRKDFEDFAREMILEYFQVVETTKIYQLFYLVYTMGISSGLSQVNAIIQSKDSFFTYDGICNVVRNIPESE